MKKFNVKIESITPYMQHRMDDTKLEEWEKTHSRVVTRPEVSQADATRAEYHCYRNKDGQCYLPADQLRGAMITAGTYVKAKVGAQTKSMKSIVAGQWMVSPAEIIIPDYDEIDKRSAVNKNVKARVITVRPKWSKLETTFQLEVDNDSTTKEMVEQILTYAGNNVGIGSFRPTNNGLFGRFKIVSVKEI